MAKHLGRGSGIENKKSRRGLEFNRSIAAGVAAAFFIFTLLLSLLLGNNLYDYPGNPDPRILQGKSVIVCLAGGKYRIETAYGLFADGIGETLWIIGAGKKSTVMTLARTQAATVAQKIPWDRFDRIQVETESRNTLENAFAVKRLLENNPEVQTLVLVTSSYHMRRAKLMIEHQISPAVKVVPFTPPNSEFERHNWWHSYIGIWLTASEYFKFVLASILVPIIGYF